MKTPTTLSMPSSATIPSRHNPVNSFLYWLTTTDRETIEQCTVGERRHRLALGWLMLIPMIFGFESGAYAASLLSGGSSAASLMGGITIAIVVMLLEKGVTAGMSSTEITAAVRTRILIAAIWSALLAPPVAIAWFHDAIEASIFKKEKAAKEGVNKQYDALRDGERKRMAEPDAVTEQARIAMQQEADGTGGTGIPNLGPIYELKKGLYEQKRAERDTLQSEVAQNLARIEAERKQELATATSGVAKGYLGRITTLWEVAKENWMVGALIIVTFLFLLFVELIAIFSKLAYNGKPHYQYEGHIIRKAAAINQIKAVESNAEVQIATAQVQTDIVIKQSAASVHKLSEDLNHMEQRNTLLQRNMQVNIVEHLAFRRDTIATAGEDPALCKAFINADFRNRFGHLPAMASYPGFTMPEHANDEAAPAAESWGYDEGEGTNSSAQTSAGDELQYDGPVYYNWQPEALNPFAVTPELLTIAQDLYRQLPQDANDEHRALAAYHWIHDNVRYSKELFGGQLLPSEVALPHIRQGVCSTMTATWVVLARLLGLRGAMALEVKIDCNGDSVSHGCGGYSHGNRLVCCDVAYHQPDCRHMGISEWRDRRVEAYFRAMLANRKEVGVLV